MQQSWKCVVLGIHVDANFRKLSPQRASTVASQPDDTAPGRSCYIFISLSLRSWEKTITTQVLLLYYIPWFFFFKKRSKRSKEKPRKPSKACARGSNLNWPKLTKAKCSSCHQVFLEVSFYIFSTILASMLFRNWWSCMKNIPSSSPAPSSNINEQIKRESHHP